MKANLEAKVKCLEVNVTQLEETVKRQELRLYDLTEQLAAAEKQVMSFVSLSKSVESSPSEDNSIRQMNVIHRTCHEAHAADSSLKSGMYWIDPDGHGIGDDPIHVHCNMTTGTVITNNPQLCKGSLWAYKFEITYVWLLLGATSIPHDSESETEVGHCARRGCYSREIKYDASDRQIAALAELSTECHQSIKVYKIYQ